MMNQKDKTVGTSSNYTGFIDNPGDLYAFISAKLKNRKSKTYKYAQVSYRKAAVLIPIFFKDAEANLLFTKRTDKVEHHKGQISFPGGMHDKRDNDLLHTALRETWEEMGIKIQDVNILGCTDNYLTNTNFLVTPYVGYFPYPYEYDINKDEISQVLEIPLRRLLDPSIFEIKRWQRKGILWDVHFYHLNGESIWGVTGFLLSNFLSIIFDLARTPD
jgi:8-oxo-dGTP pyrophosphatase MutT (NUDIX family)